MRRILVVVVLALIPLFAFAEIQLGVVGTFNPSFVGGSSVSTIGSQLKSASFSDLSFGLEGRMKVGILQLGTSAIFYDDGSNQAIDLMPTAGLSLDILFVRLGFSVGPDFWIPSGAGEVSADSAFDGWNFKLSTEFRLGHLSLGLQGVYWWDPTYSDFATFLAGIKAGELPWLGATILLRL
jgi:hypothetical protein